MVSSVWVIKRFWFPQRTLQLEIRVGRTRTPANYGLTRITANSVCGTTSSRTNTESEIVNCDSPKNGRYLTLQSLANMMLNIGEVNVYRKGMPHIIHDVPRSKCPIRNTQSFLSVALPFDFGNCPSSHPFAFNSGNDCCKHAMQDAKTGSTGCNSGYIDRESRCCFRGESTTCRKKPCLDFSCELANRTSRKASPISASYMLSWLTFYFYFF